MNIYLTNVATATTPATTAPVISPSRAIAHAFSGAQASAPPIPRRPKRMYRCWEMSSSESIKSLAKLTTSTMRWKRHFDEVRAHDVAAIAQYAPVDLSMGRGPNVAQGNSDNRSVPSAASAVLRSACDANIKAANKRYVVRTAIHRGFIKLDGSADIRAYYRFTKQRAAINAGLHQPDGSADVTQYERNVKERSAIKAGFLHENGTADIKEFCKDRRQRAALNAGFKKVDGVSNWYTYGTYRGLVCAANREACGNGGYLALNDVLPDRTQSVANCQG